MGRVFSFAVLLALAPAVSAQVSPQDRDWLIVAHQSNLAEIAAGDLSPQAAHMEAVRNVGRMLVRGHRAQDGKLQPLARRLGVKLPVVMDYSA